MTDLKHYLQLMRLHKPIGILLLLWPTMWSLFLAAAGNPSAKILVIFILGVVIMRSAGCIINDIADRHIDLHVKRTKDRPLTTQKLTTQKALIAFSCLLIFAFILVLQLNRLTIQLAFMGAALAIIYPFLKRITSLPQLGLGFAFAWGIPMGFAAVQQTIPSLAWFLYSAAILWIISYDTLYAMVDREDDIQIGVKSTAILFGKWDIFALVILQLGFMAAMFGIGFMLNLKKYYYFSLILCILIFCYQFYLIKNRNPDNCFKAFLNNHWIGLSIFIGILTGM